MILFVLPGRAPPSASALFDGVRDDAGHVLPVVGQGDPHHLRSVDLVRIAKFRDPLLDCGSELLQRYPADPPQRQLVQALPGSLRQLQPLRRNADGGLRVSLQQFIRPAPELRLRVLALVGLRFADDAVDVRVFLHVLRGQVQVILADGIESRVHPVSADALGNRRQVPPGPHLAGHSGGLPDNVQPEGVHREVVRPPCVLQRSRHSLQRVVERVPVELVRVRYVVIHLPQRPVALLPKDVPHSLLSRAAGGGGAAGNDLSVDLPEEDPVPQGADQVLQLHRGRPGGVVPIDRCHPPHNTSPRAGVVQQPAVRADARHVRRRHGGGGVPFPQLQAQRLHRHPPRLGEAVPA